MSRHMIPQHIEVVKIKLGFLVPCNLKLPDVEIELFTTIYVDNTSPAPRNHAAPSDPKVTLKSVNTFVDMFVFVAP